MADLISMLAASGAAEGEATDAEFQNTVLLLHGDGTNGAQNNTFLDSSTNNFTITRNGNTTQGTFSPFSKPDGRWGNYFDGSGDYLTWPSGASVNFGTSDFTVEAFLYVPANPVADYIIDARDASNTGGWAFAFGLSGSGYKLGFYFNNSIVLEEATESIASNTWQHCVVVRSGTTISIFIQGTRVATTTNSSDINLSPGTGYIGNRYTSAGFEFSGYMTNVRIVKSAVYDPSQTTLTVPTSPLTAIANTSLLTCQSNRFIDNSSNAFAITRNGDVKVTPFSPFPITTAYDPAVNGGSGYFDGSGDNLSVAANAAFQFGTGDFCVETWAYITNTATAASGRRMFSKYVYSGADLGMVFQVLRTSGNSVEFNIWNSSGTLQLALSANPTLAGNTWYHFAVARSGANASLYINGTRVATTSSAGSANDNYSTAVTIGSQSGGAGGTLFEGYLSNARMVKGSSIYDPTQTTITVPTAPLTAVSGTSLLTNFTNAGIFDNTGFNNLETVGNAQIDTSVVKYGTGSMEFDGTGDWIISPDGSVVEFGTGDFTMELWFYPTTTTRGMLISSRQLNTDLTSFDLQWVNSKIYFGNTATDFLIQSDTLTLNTWNHVAVTRASGTLELFINGVSKASLAGNTTNFANRGNFRIGGQTYNNLYPLTGYIDDLRITKGIARYTANFTPPTAAFPDIGD